MFTEVNQKETNENKGSKGCVWREAWEVKIMTKGENNKTRVTQVKQLNLYEYLSFKIIKPPLPNIYQYWVVIFWNIFT